MPTLAIDTSDSQCAVALAVEGQTVVQRAENIGRGHAERLLPMIGEVLDEARLTYADLTRIGVVTGPGTFTGLRIGLSVARGLALARRVPCYGVTSLIVLATQARVGDSVVHSVVKGRGGQVYWQAFKGVGEHGLPLEWGPAENVDADIAASHIRRIQGAVIGSGVPLVSEFLDESVFLGFAFADTAVLAGFLEGATELCADDYKPEPTYLRAADAVKAKAIFEVESRR